MRISDWSSDVCSSDLWIIGLADNVIDPAVFLARRGDLVAGKPAWREVAPSTDRVVDFAARRDSLYLITRRDVSTGQLVRIPGAGGPRQIIPMPKGYVLSGLEIGRASCRERVCTDG